MSDRLTTSRCPRCHGTVTEYVWHPYGVLQPPVSRFECVRCPWTRETGSIGAPATR